VGDRYVLSELRQRDWEVGGETSGHILCLDLTSTGDGIISALQVVAAMMESGESLNALKRKMEKFPQMMINVRCKPGMDLDGATPVAKAVKQTEQKLNGKGRVLLRPSGTEPVVRVMVEGEDALLVETLVRDLADVVEASVGAA